MKYKVGDKVRIKSINWYNDNKDKFGNVNIDNSRPMFTYVMSQYCGQVLTVNGQSECDGEYYMLEDGDIHVWADEMIEGLVEDGKKETIVDYVKESNDRYRIVVDYRFDIEVDEGEYYTVRRKKEYPKTYEECCKVIEVPYIKNYVAGYKNGLLNNFQKLLICLDAYWKIAGDEMGFGKPWSPNDSPYVYCIYAYKGEIFCDTPSIDCVLMFPTAEMRDAFYENFKELIEECKELL